jgi:Ca2+-transporting ATPase
MLSKPSVIPLHTAVRGRARFKIEGLVRCTALKVDLETQFPRQRQIRSAAASTITGNLLVHYSKDLDWKQVGSMVSAFISGRAMKNPAKSNPAPAAAQNESGPAVAKAESQPPVPAFPAQDTPWYLRDRIEVLNLLESDRQKGLTRSRALGRMRRWGPNTISELKGRSALRLLIDQISSAPLILLGVQGAVAAITGSMVPAALALGVVGMNVAVGYAIDSRVQKRILGLRRTARPMAEVIRNGKHTEVPGEELVVGDLLVLTPGTYVGADSRIIRATHLKIDESALTGESIPVDKISLPIGERRSSIANQDNMAFMATLVVGGKGLAVVVATGMNTEYGKMLTLATETFPPQTPLVRQLQDLTKKLLMAGGLIAALVLGLRIWRGLGLRESLRFALPIGASAMPAALPSAVSTNMAAGIKRLKKNKVSIRQLYALETMGSVRVICFDKTGTITRGRITVIRIYAAGRQWQIKNRQLVEDDRRIDPTRARNLRALMQTCVLCNESKIKFSDSGKPVLKGSPTETALMHLALLSGTDIPQIYRKRRLESVKHRGKHRRRMVTVHREPDGSARISVKGDPMEVATMCRWQLRGGRRSSLTEAALSDIEIQNERMAAEGLRILGFAYKMVAPGETIESEQDLIWIGMVGMAEPIRAGVRALMEDLHRAGIETVMITGDQSLTAQAVARKVKLTGAREPRIMDSARFETLKPELLESVVRDVQIYSRVNPSQKLQIVMALQKRVYPVAMTGDGINDGPALRAADIGIAMGLGGTDVAREVADIVLDKDDIRAIRAAVSGGRLAAANLKSAFHYSIASNMSEIIFLTAASAGAAGAPLISAHPLGINVFSEILPALSLLMEPAPRKLTDLPAIDPEAPLFSFRDAGQIAREALVMAGAAITAYGCGVLRHGPGMRSATLAHESLTAARLLHAYNMRRNSRFSGSNPYLTPALAASAGLQLLPFFVPGLRRLLKIAPLSFADLAIAAANAGLASIVNSRLRRRG